MKALPIAVPETDLARFCRENGIRRLSFFGSIVRDDFTPESDVDVLVEFEPSKRIGFIGFAGLEIDLGEMLGRRVDLNTPASISDAYLDEILSEAVPVYVAP